MAILTLRDIAATQKKELPGNSCRGAPWNDGDGGGKDKIPWGKEKSDRNELCPPHGLYLWSGVAQTPKAGKKKSTTNDLRRSLGKRILLPLV